MKYKYDSRKNCASQMKSTHNFFSAAHFATPFLTVNCQLSTVNWIHTIADFYSHSNYVELYYGYAKDNGLSTDAEDIRPFSEMMNDEKFMEFVNGEGGGLKTGEYSVLRHWSKDPESHYMNNLDKPTSKNGRKEYGNSNRHNAARNAAQEEINKIVKTSLEE